MTIDVEENNTIGTAGNGGFLSLFGGKKDDITFGAVSSSDAVDYFRYTHSDALKQVKASISFEIQSSLALLREGGIFGIVDHLSLKGGGSFSGESIEVEIRLGYDAVAEDFEKVSQAGTAGLLALTGAWIDAGAPEGFTLRQINALTEALALTGQLFEADGNDVSAKDLLASIKSAIAMAPSAEGQEFVSSLGAVLEAWETPRYFVKDGFGVSREISALAAKDLKVNWDVAGGGEKAGYLIAEGSVDIAFGNADVQASLGTPSFDYIATVAVQEETSSRVGNTIIGSKRSDVISDKATVAGQKKATSLNDTIKGNAGDDKITAGGGADAIFGGAGKDSFIYRKISESAPNKEEQDTIFDLSRDDVINLSLIDAKTGTAKNDAFTFIGTNKFSGNAGELRYEKTRSDTYIYADVNGDKKADFAIHLDDAVLLSKGYFLL